jgi:hypothetical protein
MDRPVTPPRAVLLFLAALVACGDDAAPIATPDAGPAGPACVPAALPGALSDGHWDDRFTLAGVTGHDGLTPKVFDFAVEPGGSVLAVGDFEWLGDRRVAPLLRYQGGTWTPARDHLERPVPTSGFAAVAVDGDGKLALATYDPLDPRTSEIWVDRGQGLEVVGTLAGLARSLAWYDGQLWVAGLYTLVPDTGANLMVWTGAAWIPPPGSAADGPVYGLTVDGAELLVSGGFTTVGGVAADKIAAYDGVGWTAYDLGLFAAQVYKVVRGGDGTLYAGGAFAGTRDEPVEGAPGGIAEWTGSAWQLVGGGVGNTFFPGVVTDLAVQDGALYVAGCFEHVGGATGAPGSIPADSLARWDGQAWEALDGGGVGSSWFEMGACGDESVDAIWFVDHERLVSDGTRLFLGGSAGGAGGVASQSLIVREGDAWVAQGAPGLGFAGPIDHLAVGGPSCALYAFGNGATHAGGVALPAGLARFDDDAWTPLGAPLPAGAYCPDFVVTDAGTVYLACLDQEAFVPHLLTLDGDAWRDVADLSALGQAQDLALDGAGRLWVAGGDATGYVARLDGDALTVVEGGFDAPVLRIAPAPRGDAYAVGGGFTHIAGVAFDRVAAWDGARWTAVGDGVTTTPSALLYGAHGLFVATFDEGGARTVLGRWDGTAWTELADPAHGLGAPLAMTSPTFTALVEVGDGLVASGYVWPEDGARNVFYFDFATEKWQSVGGGAGAISVDAIAVTEGSVWFGGSIAEVDLTGTPMPSVGVARFTW